VHTLLQWKSNKHYIFWVFICSLRYQACNPHAPYYHLCLVRLYNIFSHYLINGTILEMNMKYVFWFSLTLLSGIFLILRRSERGMLRQVYQFAFEVSVIFVKFQWNSNFRKIFKYKFSWKYFNFFLNCEILSVCIGVTFPARW